MNNETVFRAKWIWGGDEESPRNEWRCFRHSFVCPSDLAEDAEAILHISADSRYVAYVNGVAVGRGPVRNFPSDLFYDSHSVGHLLKRGEVNAIAVHVIHFGLSNFYYLRGRGGLLAQLDVASANGTATIAATGDHWATALHGGQDPAVSRMSCQQGFAERIDGRRYEESWMEVDYDDRRWERAVDIGEAGMEPWVRMQPRDIPYLTEDTVQPVSVLTLNRVVPFKLTAFLDNYAFMKPAGEENANVLAFVGGFGTMLKLKEEAEVTVLLQASGFGIGGEVPGLLRLGNSLVRADEMEHEPPLLRYTTRLPAGDHLLLYTAYGPDHGVMQRIAVDCEGDIQWYNPLAEATFLESGETGTGQEDAGGMNHSAMRQATVPSGERISPFVAIGPAFSFTMLDHKNQDAQFARWRREAALFAEAFATATTLQSLKELGYPAEAMPYGLANGEDAFMPQVAKRESEAYAVPNGLQKAAVRSGDPGVVPVFPNGDTEFMLDFGKEWSGYLAFELEAEEGIVVDWYGVEYRKDGYVQHTHGLDNTIRYITRKGRQRYASPVRRGFRYLIVTVRGASKPVLLHRVELTQSNYPSPEVGHFHSSDSALNAIWEMARHTTRLCMEDTFVDCPAYEQVFWVGDSRNEALVNYYLFGDTDIVKRCLRLVPGSAFQTPLYVDQVPSGWSSVIPNWTFFWVSACLEYAKHVGDKAFAAEMLPKMRFTLQHYAQHINGDGLLEINGWNLLDWAPIDQPNRGVVTHQNMMFALALRQTSAISGFAGQGEDSWCLETAASLEEAINEFLWNDEKRAYLDCIHADGRKSDIFSMQTQVIALLAGIAKGERRDKLNSYLTWSPEGFVPIGSPFMSFFYYEALMETGNVEHMLNDMRRNYGFMIDNGATTCWEMYGHTAINRANENDLTRSHCHAWSAAPGYFLGAYVLGVTSSAPGWRKVNIAPQPGGLTWANGSVPLPGGGKIDVNWTAKNGEIAQLSLTAPEGVDLDISVPDGCKVEVCRVKTLA